MPDPNDYPRIQFNASQIIDQIQSRTGPGRSENRKARTDLQRYYTLLEYVRPKFPSNAARLIVDVLNGQWYEINIDPNDYLSASFEDAEHADFEKWEVNRDTFLDRMRNLSRAEALAVIDAAERFWVSPEATVAEVGLCTQMEETNGEG